LKLKNLLVFKMKNKERSLVVDLLRFTDTINASAAIWAFALRSWSAVLHGNFFRVADLHFLPALYTICFRHIFHEGVTPIKDLPS